MSVLVSDDTARRPRRRVSTRMPELVVLDPFWPGRRPYLYDGFCRSCLLP